MHYRQPDERITDRAGMTLSTERTDPDQLFAVAGKTVVVTGGTRGIGAMIAGGFVDAGADVIVASRKTEAVEAVVDELSARGLCIGFAVDLSSEEGARRLAEEIGSVRSQVDVLVNNAGATWGAPVEEHDSASWDRVLNLNVQGVFHTTKFLLPLLVAGATADQPSRVINIGSIDGIHVPALETYSYGASKAAVHQLTRHLARRLAPTITVNAVAPGPFPSKMMAATLDAFGDQIAAAAPLKRIGRPDDMAGVTIFLASRAASYITGAVIPVDGGIATTA
jgi:NAD(P)-dependent dehydrogenase (short-subunit alcohol dehydrogenase family)